MEILVVLVVALVVLGPKRLPEAGRQVGRALSEVRKWSSTVQNEVKSVMDFDEEAPPPKSWNPDATTPATMVASPEPPPVATPGEAGSLSPDLPPPPPEAAPTEVAPAAEVTPAEVTPPEAAPAEPVPAEPVPAEPVPAEAVPAEAVPTEPVPTEPALEAETPPSGE
jgi:TatA/E family protein of Tat protein translocase